MGKGKKKGGSTAPTKEVEPKAEAKVEETSTEVKAKVEETSTEVKAKVEETPTEVKAKVEETSTEAEPEATAEVKVEAPKEKKKKSGGLFSKLFGGDKKEKEAKKADNKEEFHAEGSSSANAGTEAKGDGKVEAKETGGGGIFGGLFSSSKAADEKAAAEKAARTPEEQVAYDREKAAHGAWEKLHEAALAEEHAAREFIAAQQYVGYRMTLTDLRDLHAECNQWLGNQQTARKTIERDETKTVKLLTDDEEESIHQIRKAAKAEYKEVMAASKKKVDAKASEPAAEASREPAA